MVIVFVLAGCGTPTLDHASRGVNAQPALWVATYKNSKVYLLGSMHVLPSTVKWYGPQVRKGFESSSLLFFETIQSQKDKVFYQKYTKRHGFLPKGRVVRDYLSAKEYAKYVEIVKGIGLDRYYADRMKPWLFFLSFNSVVTKTFAQYGVDNLLENEARKRGKEIRALESISEALSALSSVKLSQDIKSLKKFLNQSKMTPAQMRKRDDLLIAWAIGDTARAERLLRKGLKREQYNRMLVKRNNRWYPHIKRLLKRGDTTMVVVGLGHLIGRGNVIQKLKRDGYVVKRLQ